MVYVLNNQCVCICERFVEILLSPKSWNSCGILLLSSTLVFSIFFCSSEGLLGLGFATFIGSLDKTKTKTPLSADLFHTCMMNKQNTVIYFSHQKLEMPACDHKVTTSISTATD